MATCGGINFRLNSYQPWDNPKQTSAMMTRVACCRYDGWNNQLSTKYILEKLVVYVDSNLWSLVVWISDGLVIYWLWDNPKHTSTVVASVSHQTLSDRWNNQLSTKYILKKLVVYLGVHCKLVLSISNWLVINREIIQSILLTVEGAAAGMMVEIISYQPSIS